MTREQVAEAQRLSREWKPRDTKTRNEDDLDTVGRSASALEADRLQERVVYSSRVWQIWALIAVLTVGVGVSVWQNVSMIYIVASIAAWIVFSLHISFTAILHELYELNDQIAGRKDEFRRTIQTHIASSFATTTPTTLPARSKGDRWPDLWVSNHQSSATVYVNNRDGTFTELSIIDDMGDTHGAAWADFDNDGERHSRLIHIDDRIPKNEDLSVVCRIPKRDNGTIRGINIARHCRTFKVHY